MSTTDPGRGDTVKVNGTRQRNAIRHLRQRGETGIVTSIDAQCARDGLPSIEVMFDTPAPCKDGTRFELFYPRELDTED